MSVKYDGKSPSKLWYFWQNTKALARTPFEYTTQNDAKKAGKDTGFFVGTVAATEAVLHIGLIAALPVLPTVIGIVGCLVAGNYAIKAYQKIHLLKNSSFVYGYVRERENQWLHKKADGNALQRGLKSIKDKVANIGNKIPLPVVKAGKWLGIAAASVGAVAGVAAGLSYAGVPAFSTGAAATSILGGIASAGAVVGLSAAAAVATVTGIAVAAIPLGLVASAWCRKNAYARNPDRPSFKKPSSGNNQPIDRGQVFSPKAASFDFNASSPSGTPTNNNSELSEARKKAAEARQGRKRDNSNRFN